MADLEILSAGAVKPAMQVLVPAFEAARGVSVEASFGPAPELKARTRDGTGSIGLLAGPKALIGELAAAGKLDAASRRALGGVKAAIALHRDAPVPDLSTPDAVRAAVLAAAAIVYNTASSGQYIDQMIRGLGIADTVEPRVQRLPTAEDAMRFLGSDAGRTAIGFGQSSAICGYEQAFAVRLAAPLPDAIGNVTEYEVAVATAAPRPELAEAFIAFLTGPEGVAALRAIGVQ